MIPLNVDLLKRIEKSPGIFAENCRRRRVEVDVDAICRLNQQRRALIQQVHECNSLRREFREASENAVQAKESMRSLDHKLEQVSATLAALLEGMPNSTAPDTPESNAVIDLIGPDTGHWKQPLDHLQIAERLDAVRSVPTATGSQLYYLTGIGAQLEMALVRLAVKKAAERGYRLIKPPDIIRDYVVSGAGFQPRGRSADVYRLADDQCLAATSEIAMLGFYSGSSVRETQKVVAWSHCFRPECGHHGAESRGLYRVHQFTKVELFSVCAPHESESVLQEFVEVQRDIIGLLGVTARLVQMSASELGMPAYKKYDWEAWFPARLGAGSWGELTSASNCTDYQSRRLCIKHGDVFASTVNATALAVPRVIQILLECYYADGRLQLPQLLQKELY